MASPAELELHETPRGLLRSSGAATLAQLVRVAAILATHLALRRLIPREDWGLRDWTEALFLILATVRDLGLPSHVVRLRPMPLGNLLRLQAFWGGALAALLLVGAPALATLFETPRGDVALVIRAMAVYLLFEGLAAVPLTWFEAELRIGRAVLPDLARTFTYCLAALGFALNGFGVWAFVCAMIASQLVHTAWLWRRALAARPAIPLHDEPGRTLEMLRASIPLGSIWLLAFAVSYVDALLLGARFPDAAVGGYMFALVWAFFAFRILQQPIGRALYPAFVRFRDDRARQFEAYRLATKAILALEVPAALVLYLNADLAVRLLGGADYAGQASLLALLAFAPLVDPLGQFGGELLIARHRDRLRVASLVVQLAALVGFGLWLSAAHGPIGMAWARFLPLGAPLLVWAIARDDGRDLGRLLLDLAEVYLAPLPLFALAWWAGRGAPWRLFTLTLLAAVLSVAWFWRRFGGRFVAYFGGAETASPHSR